MGIEYKTDCPIRAVLKVLGGKWPLLVLSKLEGSMRFSAIKREIPEISEKMLIETLKQLTENNRDVEILNPFHLMLNIK